MIRYDISTSRRQLFLVEHNSSKQLWKSELVIASVYGKPLSEMTVCATITTGSDHLSPDVNAFGDKKYTMINITLTSTVNISIQML